MWDRLRISERERRLALLFLTVALATVAGAILTEQVSNFGRVWFAIPVVVGVVCLARGLLGAGRRPGRAAVGPLSPDELDKARSRLSPRRKTQLSKP
jgi:peptidoglycan/LPS O-acetylase OafA/YrhL